jgi:hypothetical protein
LKFETEREKQRERERGCYVSREKRNIRAKGYFEIDGKA